MEWPRAVFLALEWTWLVAGTLCLAAAAAFLLRPEATARADGWIAKRGPILGAVLALAVPATLCIWKLAQYRAYQLLGDSGIIANAAWNLAHGYGWTSSVLSDKSYFAIHFSFTIALLSPVLRLWPSTAALATAQAIAVGSTVLGVYWLGHLRWGASLAACLAALLVLSHPFFHALAGSVVDNSPFALPFFIWGIYCWESGRGRTAALFAILFLTTREQAPFLFAGFGLLVLARAANRREGLTGAALIGGAALLFLGELAVCDYARRGWLNYPNWWIRYSHLGLSAREVSQTALYRPWEFAWALIYPLDKIWALARVFFSLALLPLASGTWILPALTIWLPQMLSNLPNFYAMKDHYSAMASGPLFWSAIVGLGRVRKMAGPAGRRLVTSWVLIVCAWGFFSAPGFTRVEEPLIVKLWHGPGMRALAAVPPQAKLWCDDIFLPHTAMRRYVKALPLKPTYFFDEGLFLPDRVLLSKHWLTLADRDLREQLLRLWAERGFLPIFQEEGLTVLANPRSAADGSGPVEWIALPKN